MSIPNEALQKLVQEIETQAILAQREINTVKAAVATKHRDVRLLELTTEELKSLPPNTNIFEGVGKMFVSSSCKVIQQRLNADTSELKSDITNLNKKLHYLETTYKNSRTHIDQILKSGGRS